MQHCAVQHVAKGRDAAQLCCGAAKSRVRLVGGFGFWAPRVGPAQARSVNAPLSKNFYFLLEIGTLPYLTAKSVWA